MQKSFENFRKSNPTVYRKDNVSQPSGVYPRNGMEDQLNILRCN